MRRKPFYASMLLGIAFGLTLAGCGPRRPTVAPVSGHVTYQGRPLAAGRIMFWPQSGSRPAMGDIGSDGGYRLTTFVAGDGAMLGGCRVTIEAKQDTPPPPASRSNPYPVCGIKWLVPEKYARQETSPLTAEVKPGDNTIDFALP